MKPARQAVNRLLDMYAEYLALAEQITKVEREVALAKIKNCNSDAVSSKLEKLRSCQQQLSDKMTFDTPLIWVMYKFEAYKDQAQPICTLHDFRLHCSKPGYICTSRFNFLNETLLQKHQKPLSDELFYPDDMLLDKIYPVLLNLELDSDFMENWRRYEYCQIDGAIKKWQNYKT